MVFIYSKIYKLYSSITSNFFVFVQFVVNYVAWPAPNSLANCRPVPMYFCNIFSNLNKVEVDQFWCTRNKANNTIKLAKKLSVSDNLEANKGNLRKTWNVINELTSRNSGKSTNILEIKVDNKIASNPMDIAETINDHFTNVAQVLAQDILLSMLILSLI